MATGPSTPRPGGTCPSADRALLGEGRDHDGHGVQGRERAPEVEAEHVLRNLAEHQENGVGVTVDNQLEVLGAGLLHPAEERQCVGVQFLVPARRHVLHVIVPAVTLKVHGDLARAVAQDVCLVAYLAERHPLAHGQVRGRGLAPGQLFHVRPAVIELEAGAPEVGYDSAEVCLAVLRGHWTSGLVREDPAAALLVLAQRREQDLIGVVEPQLIQMRVGARALPVPVDPAERVAVLGREPEVPLLGEVLVRDGQQGPEGRAAGAPVAQSAPHEADGAAAVEPGGGRTTSAVQRLPEAPVAPPEQLRVACGIARGQGQGHG
mmetsp:Transcript_18999/g.55130  ORF Transcript_18999/g.55130 Transcript_18999/m.55130 type:complete len:320 (-) Transcript_18999:300-1259(-)